MKKKFLNVLEILNKIPTKELGEIEFYDMVDEKV